MSNWKTYKLGEICTDISYGYTESASLETVGPKFLRITDIQHNFINWDNVPYCPITESNHKKYKLEVGDIVIARTGASTGATAIFKDTDIDAVYASYLIRYKIDKTKADPFYIGYILKSPLWKQHVNSIIGGSGQPGANAKQFASFEIQAPDLDTQVEIAQILSSLNNKIELLQQMNQTLENIAQTIFKEWFVDFNFPGIDGELVDGLPKGWRMGKVKDVYKTTSGGTPSRAKGEYYENGTINWVKSKELNGNFIFDTEEKITEKAVKNSSAKLIPKHSILLAMYGATVGEYAITGRETTCNQAICAVIEKELPYTYFFEYFKNNRNSIIGRASGSAQQNISQALIQQLEILIPSIETVNNYHLVVEPLFNKMEENLLQIQTLTQTRDTLLPRLMSGRLEIKN